MIKYYIRLLMLVGAIILILALIGSLLPRDYDFSATTKINANRSVVFEELNSLKNWGDWSPWNPGKIPGLTVKYTGPDSGVGSTQSWTEPRGTGKMWLTTSEPDDLIAYQLVAPNFPEMISELRLSGDGNQTTLVWSSEGTLPGGPFYGVMAPFFSTHMQDQYEKSLAQLKKKLEAKKLESKAPADASNEPG